MFFVHQLLQINIFGLFYFLTIKHKISIKISLLSLLYINFLLLIDKFLIKDNMITQLNKFIFVYF